MTIRKLQNTVFSPLTNRNWHDLESLFGEHGACGGCWCMYWRFPNREFQKKKGAGNRKALRKLVSSDKPLGVIAYRDNKPVGWCSISPRSDLVRLETSRLFKPMDEKPVWSITCLFVNKDYRRQGLSAHLIEAACNYAQGLGAQIIEAYPIIPQKDNVPDVFAWVGFAHAFEKAGFRVAEKRSETRAIMRYEPV